MTFDLSEYQQFIASKAAQADSHGFAAHDLPERLFPHQRSAVEFACEKGRAALFLDTGLGKSGCEAAFSDQCIRQTGKPALILTPLAVAHQMRRECEAFGIEARVIREDADVWPGVNIANYERLPKITPAQFGAVVLDECFAAGTPIDVVDKDGSVSQKHIENVRAGDSILNASGVDRVSDVHRREVPYAIRITVGGSVFVCSPNHPIFTQRGWTPAQCLQPGDRALVTSEAVRLVREGVFSEVSCAATRTILRAVLLSEMADASAGNCGEGALTGGRSETRREAVCMASVGRSEGQGGDCSDYGVEPGVSAGGAGENLPPIESHEARTFRAWGQWSRDDEAAIDFAGCTRERLDGGISFVTGATGTGLSDALQDRFGAPGKENRRRGGWSVAQQQAGTGSEEGCETGFARVDSLEVLEPGNPDLERLRDADGKLYFYDLGGTRHPSFSVHGLLVHNSSILKSFTGPTKRALCEAFAGTPYRLAATATPAPNDHMELGQHSEFLGYLGSMEMLCRWFINDTSTASQEWRLKGHAEADFWQWVASWSRAASLPSDLGGDDSGFVLPPLRFQVHEVQADVSEATDGMLFRIPDQSATSIHKEKRLTQAQRVAMAAEVANGTADPVVVWCETNDESAALAKAIPDAVEIVGSMTPEQKEARIEAFLTGNARVMVTKPKLAGFGLNMQHCHTTVFASISHSYEQHYQAVRRFYRFGQRQQVTAHVVISDTERAIWANVKRKSEDHDRLKKAMAKAMRGAQTASRKVAYTRAPDVALPKFLTKKEQSNAA